MAAGRALEAADVLPGEEVGELAGISVEVAVKFSFGGDEGGCSFALGFFFGGQSLEGGARPAGVEVFVEGVDEEVEEFFGVLLAVEAPFFV